MYDELIKQLREATGWKNASVHYSLMNRAADALEELQKTVLRLEDESGILDELPMVDQREPPKAEEAE